MIGKKKNCARWLFNIDYHNCNSVLTNTSNELKFNLNEIDYNQAKQTQNGKKEKTRKWKSLREWYISSRATVSRTLKGCQTPLGSEFFR